ncbi:MAG: spermine synthase, partial [Gammaproteobacteria bacterium]|nr:spermine synthase [Gammaproteobacteria bacterium]
MQTDPSTRRLGLILLSLYLISGASSLAYEILWTRMLSLQFGVSIFGVVATVTAYMAGLGIGSFFGVRWSQRTRHPLRLFALLELSVAGAALIIPVLFQTLDAQFAVMAGNMAFSGWLTLQVVVVTLVLMIPALGMGAGFPLVLRTVQNTRISFAGIYGINALGGALGALLPLWLLPHLGWLSSLRAVAALGLVVGLIALWMSRQRIVDVAPPNSALLRPPWGWVFAYAGIGAGALILEIGWTRLYGMVMLRTEYVLAIILAVFLVGIGAGSLISRYLSQRLWFSVLPVIAGGFAILSLWLLPTLSSWVEQARFDSLAAALMSQASAVVSMTLPVTLVLGAWLPLLAARLGNRYQSGVWLYGANSLGAAVGAMLAGFILIPAFGTSATIVLGAMLLLALGAVLAHGWSPVRPVWAAFVLLGLLAAPVLDMPPVSALMPLAYGQTRPLSLHEDAISITHVVEGPDGQRQLLADLRRMDASSDPTAVAAQMNQVRLPLMLHPEPHHALFLGLG